MKSRMLMHIFTLVLTLMAGWNLGRWYEGRRSSDLSDTLSMCIAYVGTCTRQLDYCEHAKPAAVHPEAM